MHEYVLILGQEVYKSTLKNQAVGIHQATIQLPKAAATSIYFVRLETQNNTQVVELINR